MVHPRQGSMDLTISDWDDARPDPVHDDHTDDQGTSDNSPQINAGAIYSAIESHGLSQSDDVAAPPPADSSNNGQQPGGTSIRQQKRRVSIDNSAKEQDASVHHPPRKSSSKMMRKLSMGSSNSLKTDKTQSLCQSSHGSGATSHSSANNIWSRLLFPHNSEWWHGKTFDDYTEEEEEEDDCSLTDHRDGAPSAAQNCRRASQQCTLSFLYETRHFFRTCLTHPSIVLWSTVTFAILCTAGLMAVNAAHDSARSDAQHTATWIATETADWFSTQFSAAMKPLYSVQQAVIHSGYFDEIPFQIGPFPQNVIPGTNETFIKRNVVGICDQPELQQKWRDVVEPVNRENDLDGIVVGYRLFPSNVACLTEPSELQGGTEHFDLGDFITPGATLASDFVFGFDAGHDVNSPLAGLWQTITSDLYVKKKFNVFGPFEMPPMTELICGHLAIYYPPGADADPPYKTVLDVHGVKVPNAYGMVVNFLDWTKLKDRSNIYEKFADCNLDFCLTKINDMDPSTNVTLAESPGGGCTNLNDSNSIVVETTSLHGVWYNRVGTSGGKGWDRSWYPYAVAAVVVTSFLLAFLTAVVLVERQLHRDLLYKVMPRRAIAKLQRGQTVVEKYNLVTIFFSDIVGFTTMAGEMRPLQVMKMLNELYTEFDKIAERHRVYKVETIGDAYMVVGGAPDRCSAPEAAQRVASFALDVTNFVRNFRTKDGDKILIRCGIASGPVVAGVVGSTMPRFCFFGDTVNLASRMESTSKKMKIQASNLTHRLLMDAPSKDFVLERRVEGDQVGIEVKGKGHQITHWIVGANKRAGTHKVVPPPTLDVESPENVYSNETLGKESVLENSRAESDAVSDIPSDVYKEISSQDWANLSVPESSIDVATADAGKDIDCVTSILEQHLERCALERGMSMLRRDVKAQLRMYVAEIKKTYNDVKFHSFQHACHVTMSMNKLVSVLQAETKGVVAKADPLCGFSLVFSALVHDAGHTGMSNQFLKDQQHPLAVRYNDEDLPIAERYSIQLALEILFKDEYGLLRSVIIPDVVDKVHFSKVLFQSVLVTDIATRGRIQLSIKRFEVASGPSLDNKLCDCAVCHKEHDQSDSSYDPGLCPLVRYLSDVMEAADVGQDVIERYPEEFAITHCGLRRCVLNEHLMQTSDVAHLMQSWPTFAKWNFRLYKEIMECHLSGLCSDPTEGWYEGQIGFFENYAIPLAIRTKKFFDEDFGQILVQMAEQNLEMWRQHGKETSEAMSRAVKEGECEANVLEFINALSLKHQHWF